MKKITKTTFKSLVKKNEGNLYIWNLSHFDGTVDGRVSCKSTWRKVEPTTLHKDNTLGINGVWLVNGSRDYFTPYNENGFTGIEVSNCCGHFVVATKN